MRLSVVTWNVHGCVGTDGRFDPERTARRLAALAPDVALLQEVGDVRGIHPPIDQATLLADTLGMVSILGTTLARGPYGYGSVTLTRFPPTASETYDLSVHGREPRVGLCVALGGAATPLFTVNLHLGLGRRERRTQLGILLDEAGPLPGDPEVPTLVGGDFNDWPPGSVTRAFETLLRDAARSLSPRPPPSFPSWRPLLRLDRLYVSAAIQVRTCAVVDTPELRLASDHLPLQADLSVEEAP